MAYNLYQAQMAKAWAQRVEKEQMMAERFWANYAMHGERHAADSDDRTFLSRSGLGMMPYGNLKDVETCSSIAPTYVSDLTMETSSTELLKERLASLEEELVTEREKRLKIEETLQALQKNERGSSTA